MTEYRFCPRCGSLMIATTNGYFCQSCGTALPVKFITINTGTVKIPREYIVKEHPLFPYEEPKPTEIIRCKDCIYYEVGQNEVDAWRVCQVHHRPIDTWDDNYCGWAERREDESVE